MIPIGWKYKESNEYDILDRVRCHTFGNLRLADSEPLKIGGIKMEFARLSYNEKIRFYIDNVIPVINEEALFCDGTDQYRNPAEPMPYDTVTIRFRTAKENVDHVYLAAGTERILMRRTYADTWFDYYEGKFILEDTRVEYYFEIHSGRMCCYYNAIGVSNEPNPEFNFFIAPGFKTPDWAKGAIFYQIFTDRFYNGDRGTNVKDREYVYIGEGVTEVTDWSKYPAAMGVREFYGGDLAGIWKKLDYLQDLGVDVLYLNPIFVSPSNHKYDIQDYDYVDPHYGKIVKDQGECLPETEHSNSEATKYICRVTDPENLEASNQFFAEFVQEVHRRGMKIILDGVFNHCGSFNKWMDREKIYKAQGGYAPGAFVSEESPYRTYFQFMEEGWPDNTHYDGWWGHDTLPKLNYEDSTELFEDVMRIARKWVSPPYNVDGWRLDVAADLGHSPEFNHYFWKEFRKNVREANPNAIILAEHYGNATSWLQGDEWDTVMNYDAFMEPLTWFLTGVEKHSDEFRPDLLGSSEAFFGSMRYYMTRFNTQSLQVAMNELSNHDHSRFLTRTNGRVGRVFSVGAEAANDGVRKGLMRAAVVVQMTWPGAPTIYYGDEAGVCGWTDPDNRRTYPWGSEDQELISLHKELIRIHKDYKALMTGSIKFLDGGQDYIAYGRFYAEEKFLVAVNRGDSEKSVRIPVWQIGMTDHENLVRMILTREFDHTLEMCIYHAKDGYLNLTLPPVSAMIIKNLIY